MSAHECEPICPDCLAGAAADIRLLPLDYFDLKRDVARKSGAADTKITRPVPRSMPPIDLNVDALARDIAWTLTVWEPAVRDAAGLGPEARRHVREGWSVSAAVAVIAPRVDVLAGLPPTTCYADGLDAGLVERDGRYAVDQLRRVHKRARAALGLTTVVIRLPGECSAGCQGHPLRRKAGSETVWCDTCGRRWTYDDYRKYVSLINVGAAGVTK